MSGEASPTRASAATAAPRQRRRRSAIVSAALAGAFALAAGSPLRGHDFWIEPTTDRPAAGALVGLRLRVGEHFVGDPVPRDPALLRRVAVLDTSGERPIPGADGRDPVGLLRADTAAGPAVVVYESAPSAAETDREKLTRYPIDEGLTGLPGLAAATGYPPGRETTRDLFSRERGATHSSE